MPNFNLIRRFEDGREEASDYTADLGSGIEVGSTLQLDDEEWTIDNVIVGEEGTPTTLIVTRH